MEQLTKVCSKCGRELPLSGFYKDRGGRCGVGASCKECAMARARRWHHENPEKVKERHRRWYTSNKEKAKERTRIWADANTDKTKEYKRKWCASNLEYSRERHKRRYAENAEIIKSKSARWRADNPEKARKISKRKRVNLPDYLVRTLLVAQHFPPESITPELIEYKRTQLKLYREIKNQQSNERH